MSSRFYLIAVVAGLSVVQARAADEPAGYLVSGQERAPVTSAYGACVRTSQWSSETSHRQCAAPFRISMDALFDFDSAVLRADAGPALDELARQLAQTGYQTLAVVGHADRIGREKYNQQLSERRAKAVRDHLAASGIDGSRIAVSGVGSAQSVTAGRCEGLRGKDRISCLQPDRYTEISVTRTQTSAMR
jgi:OmpA-OmpF porin, OOP family